MDEKKIHNLKYIYGFALTFIGLTLISSAFLMHYNINKNNSNSNLINFSGAQRMSSQRITKCILALEYEKSPEERKNRLAELTNTLNRWKKTRQALQHGDDKQGLPYRENTPLVKALLAESEPYYAAMFTAATELLENSREHDLDPEILKRTAKVILANEAHYLDLSEKITIQFQKESENRINSLKNLENSILAIGLTALLLIFLFVFRPSLARLTKSVALLKDSEERIRTITDTAGDAILMMGPQGAISYWNPAAEQILGYQSGEAIGKDLHKLLVPERYHADHYAVLPNFLRTGQGDAIGKTRRLFAIRKDGQEIAVSLSKLAVLLNGSWHAVGVLRDITESLQQEEALRQSEEFTRATLDAIMANICVLDEEGTILAVNQKWRDFADANPPIPDNYGIGVNYLEICDAVQGADQEAARLFSRGITSVLRRERASYDLDEYACHSATEQRWFHARVTRFTRSGPVRLVVSHENITERKLAEEEIAAKNATLEREKNLAHLLLKTILPENLQIRGFRTALFFKPSDQIGGDFFDSWSDGDYAHFLVGDISGHSISAALLMAVCKGLFMSIGKEHNDPAEIITIANRTLSRMLTESGMYLTMIYTVCDVRRRVLRVASAGHNPAYLYSVSSRVPIESTGPPIGWDPEDSWTLAEYPFLEGDKVLLYTDGVIETRNSAGEYCNTDIFAEIDVTFSEEAMVRSVFNLAESFCSGAFDDDLTLFAIGYDSATISSDTNSVEQFKFPLEVQFSSAETLREKIKAILLARFSGLALPCIDDFCQVVSELVNNGVEHGQCSLMEGEFIVDAHAVSFTLITDGIRFDSTITEAAMPDFGQDGELPTGGYGLAIIRQLSDAFTYDYTDGKNMTTVMKHIIQEIV